MKFKELIDAVTEDVTFYRDIQNKEAFFAEYYDGQGVQIFTRLESEDFRAFLCMRALEITDDEQMLNEKSAIKFLRHQLKYYGCPNKTEVFIRTAGDLENGIEYDLKDDKQRSVIVTDEGWKTSKEKYHKFLSSSSSFAQVKPRKSDKGVLELLKPFVNLDGSDYVLFVVWLVQAFCSGHHSALLVSAPKGCGKSSTSRLIRLLLEPSEIDVTRFSKTEEKLLVTLSNLYLVCFDNVRDITVEQSDLLCSAITGSTAAGRTLFTNNDLFVQKLHNTVVINGISVLPKETDLAERFLIVNLKKISEGKRKREKEFWDSFNQERPYILGAIFDTLSKAMVHFKTLNLKNMPRMADSFADMVAIALALGISEEEFRAIYDDNVAKMNKLRSETPIVKAVKDLMTSLNGRRSVEDTAENILERLRSTYTGDINDLPADASHLTRAAEEDHKALLEAGFRMNIDDTFSDATRIKIIKKKPKRTKK